jgi:modulator of FtsH protease
MNESLQNQYGYAQGGLAADRQRVLRNTYWLLALSLVPTVLGAWIGVATGLFATMSPGMSALVFFIGAFGLMFVVEKTKDSAVGVAALLGFKNGTSLVMTAFGGTAAIFFAMASLATVIKRDLSSMGKFLLVGAVILMVAGIANIFLQSSALMLTVLVLALAVFSAFMLYDMKRVIDGGETNYISATLAIYLDIYNVFQSLLSLLGIFGGDRD